MLLSATELNAFTEEMEQQALDEIPLRWVFSVLGEEIRSGESTHQKVSSTVLHHKYDIEILP